MNDKELADAVVALGIGQSILVDRGELYRYDDAEFTWSFDDTAEEFVRDWLVVGALAEKLTYNDLLDILEKRPATTLGDLVSARDLIEVFVEASA